MCLCYFHSRHNKCYHTIKQTLRQQVLNKLHYSCPTKPPQELETYRWDGSRIRLGFAAYTLSFQGFHHRLKQRSLLLPTPMPETRAHGYGWAKAFLVSALPVLLPVPVPHPLCLGSSQLSSHTPGAKFILASLCKGAASCHSSGGIRNGRMLYKTQKTQSIPRGRRCTIAVRQVYKTAWKRCFWAFFALLFWEELVGGGYVSMVVN